MTDLLGPRRLNGQRILFYTDDVGLFPATRRLSRDGDPPRPAIDSKLANQGSDMVFEPLLTVKRALINRLGRLDLNVESLGFDFTDNSEFNHDTLRLHATQDLSSSTRAQARFYYAPNQFLGNNEERQSGQLLLSAERFTSYIWSTRLIYNLTPDVLVKLLGRYGMRRYNEVVSERNINFWTISRHVDWRVAPKIKLGLSYHYEYLSSDADVELTERLSLLTAFHFEHNIWTSSLAGDERNGAYENIYQGEVILAYRLTDSIRDSGGVSILAARRVSSRVP